MSEPWIMWEGEHVWVSALHGFGAACLRGTGLKMRVLASYRTPADAAFDHRLDVDDVMRALAEWRENRGRIRRAERRAQDFGLGYYYGRGAGASGAENRGSREGA